MANKMQIESKSISSADNHNRIIHFSIIADLLFAHSHFELLKSKHMDEICYLG